MVMDFATKLIDIGGGTICAMEVGSAYVDSTDGRHWHVNARVQMRIGEKFTEMMLPDSYQNESDARWLADSLNDPDDQTAFDV